MFSPATCVEIHGGLEIGVAEPFLFGHDFALLPGDEHRVEEKIR